jgi:tRNA-dihydrouridine synthase B
MAFIWSTAGRPLVALAPMAGVTDASYRQFIKKIAPETIVYTEFLSTDALAYGAKKTLQMMHFDPAIERPFIVQVFGHKAEHFLEAAKIIEQMGADGIDINMGCPAAKVVSSCHGAALIKEPQLAAELVHATCKAVSIPVSVKTRLGWDKKEGLIEFCQGLVDAGAQALAIHGRRFCDKFGGKADWEPIYELKRRVNVPVIGNGDIASAKDAVEKIGNLDGVMVGRGTFGNPWLMAEIVDAFGIAKPESQIAKDPSRFALRDSQFSRPRTFQEKLPFILEHCELAVRHKGEMIGMREMRRHLASYVKGFEGASAMRSKLMTVETLRETKEILGSYDLVPCQLSVPAGV